MKLLAVVPEHPALNLLQKILDRLLQVLTGGHIVVSPEHIQNPCFQLHGIGIIHDLAQYIK